MLNKFYLPYEKQPVLPTVGTSVRHKSLTMYVGLHSHHTYCSWLHGEITL